MFQFIKKQKESGKMPEITLRLVYGGGTVTVFSET